MSTRPHRTRRRPRQQPGHTGARALVAVTSAAHTQRAAIAATTAVIEAPAPVVGSLCSGFGGLDLGVLAALGGGRIAWCADPDPHIAQILAARMPGVPNLGDLRTVDWTEVEQVDVLTAGWPCQDISAAGRRAGIEKGARSGLWTNVVESIRILRPAVCVLENVAALRWRSGGLHRVLGDLAETGYDALWRSVRASDIGAAHRRERVFLCAWPRTAAADSGGGGSDAANTDRARRFLQRHLGGQQTRRSLAAGSVAVAADAAGVGHPHGGATGGRWCPTAAVTAGASAGGPQGVPANTSRDRRDEGLPGTAGFQGRSDAALGGHAAVRTANRRRHLVAVATTADQQPPAPTSTRPQVDWGHYAPAIRRWEQTLERSAPFPTQLGRHSRPVLAPAFVEWLQGLEPGWVTGLALPRTAELRALGNGVVPQQAAYAVSLLLADLAAFLGAATSPACDGRLGHGQEANAA